MVINVNVGIRVKQYIRALSLKIYTVIVKHYVIVVQSAPFNVQWLFKLE